MIHQELHPIPHRSVMENIWLGRFPLRRIAGVSFVDHRAMYRATQALFQSLGMSIDPATKVGNLSVSKIQSVEIAKAVSYSAKVIIMDEPTSSLTENEVEHLFRIIRDLKGRGVAIIYISHKMEEILKISDEVTIMRDGKRVITSPAAQLTEDLIIRNMVGRDLTHRFPERSNVPGEVVLSVRGLTSPTAKSFRDVSFDLRKGEILGIGGLVGAQRTELVEAIFGLRAISAGTVELSGPAGGHRHADAEAGQGAGDGAPHRGPPRVGDLPRRSRCSRTASSPTCGATFASCSSTTGRAVPPAPA